MNSIGAFTSTPAGDISFTSPEKALIKALQHEFPILENPFGLIADRIEQDTNTVLFTVRGWIKAGIIRRFGARLSHRKINYTVNMLTAWSGDNLDKLGETFALIDNISHCYRRESYPNWPYELYAMIHAKSEDEMSEIIDSMKKDAPDALMIRLKTLKELKKTVMKYFLEES